MVIECAGLLGTNSCYADYSVIHTIVSSANTQLAGGVIVKPKALRKVSLTSCQSDQINPASLNPYFLCFSVGQKTQKNRAKLPATALKSI